MSAPPGAKKKKRGEGGEGREWRRREIGMELWMVRVSPFPMIFKKKGGGKKGERGGMRQASFSPMLEIYSFQLRGGKRKERRGRVGKASNNFSNWIPSVKKKKGGKKGGGKKRQFQLAPTRRLEQSLTCERKKEKKRRRKKHASWVVLVEVLYSP